MKDIDLDFFIKNIADLCAVPIRYFVDGSFKNIYSTVEIKIDPFEFVKDEIFKLEKHIDYFTSKNNFYYVIVQNENTKIIIGPSFFNIPEDYTLNRICFEFNLNREDSISFKNTIKTINRFPLETLLQIACSLNYILNDEKIKLGDLLMKDLKVPTQQIEQKEQNENEKIVLPHNTMKIENEILSIVKSGDLNKLKFYIENIPSFRTNSIVENQIRQSKDLFITTIALITRAAISEGVNIEEALTLSDNFIQKIENSRTMKELNEIILSALTEFTTKVSYLKNVQTQTEFTLKLSNFIIHNISRKLTIDDLVNNFYISKTSLCEKVKNDSGLTVNEFINTTKIGVAKDLLSNTTNSILSISDYLGFSSQNHFVKVFKKYVGVTPSEYRKNQNLKNS